MSNNEKLTSTSNPELTVTNESPAGEYTSLAEKWGKLASGSLAVQDSVDAKEVTVAEASSDADNTLKTPEVEVMNYAKVAEAKEDEYKTSAGVYSGMAEEYAKYVALKKVYDSDPRGLKKPEASTVTKGQLDDAAVTVVIAQSAMALSKVEEVVGIPLSVAETKVVKDALKEYREVEIAKIDTLDADDLQKDQALNELNTELELMDLYALGAPEEVKTYEDNKLQQYENALQARISNLHIRAMSGENLEEETTVEVDAPDALGKLVEARKEYAMDLANSQGVLVDAYSTADTRSEYQEALASAVNDHSDYVMNEVVKYLESQVGEKLVDGNVTKENLKELLSELSEEDHSVVVANVEAEMTELEEGSEDYANLQDVLTLLKSKEDLGQGLKEVSAQYIIEEGDQLSDEVTEQRLLMKGYEQNEDGEVVKAETKVGKLQRGLNKLGKLIKKNPLKYAVASVGAVVTTGLLLPAVPTMAVSATMLAVTLAGKRNADHVVSKKTGLSYAEQKSKKAQKTVEEEYAKLKAQSNSEEELLELMQKSDVLNEYAKQESRKNRTTLAVGVAGVAASGLLAGLVGNLSSKLNVSLPEVKLPFTGGESETAKAVADTAGSVSSGTEVATTGFDLASMPNIGEGVTVNYSDGAEHILKGLFEQSEYGSIDGQTAHKIWLNIVETAQAEGVNMDTIFVDGSGNGVPMDQIGKDIMYNDGTVAKDWWLNNDSKLEGVHLSEKAMEVAKTYMANR